MTRAPESGFRLARIAAVGAWCGWAGSGAAAAIPPATLPELTGSVRGTALGGATVALGGDPGLAWSSPAAAAGLVAPVIAVSGQRGFIDDLTWQALGAAPLGPVAVTAVAAWYDSGEAAVTGADGRPRRVSAQREALVALGGAMPLGSRLEAGATVRWLHSELLEEVSARAVTGDAGVAVRLGERVRLGAAVAHAGSDLRYDPARVRLPLAAVAGAGCELPVDLSFAEDRDRLRLAAQGAWRPHERRAEWRGGVEYARPRLASLRLGAHRPPSADRWRITLGLGIEAGRLTLDYATWLSGASGSPHLVGLTVRLGPTREAG